MNQKRLETIGFRKQRRLEREYVRPNQIEAKAKGLPVPNIPNPIERKLGFQASRSSSVSPRQTPLNVWERLDRLSPSRLMTLFPTSLIDKDIKGVQQIEDKTSQILERQKQHQAQQQQNREALRQALAKQHEKWAELEQRCGVVKLRDEGVDQSADTLRTSLYGFSRTHLVSPRTDVLSRPKHNRGPKEPLKHFDFRGMISADFKSVISHFKPGSSLSHSPAKRTADVQRPLRLKFEPFDTADWRNSIERVERISGSNASKVGYSRSDLIKYYQDNF
jgi:hypothetical protein